MNYRLNPSECKSAFEELYRSSPVPLSVRSSSNSSILSAGNKSIFRSPQPLCHNQLISPRPLATCSTSGHKLDPKAFDLLKKHDGQMQVNGFDSEGTMTEGGGGDVVDGSTQELHGRGKQANPHSQPSLATSNMLNGGDAHCLQEEDSDEHFINNFFSKKAPRNVESHSPSRTEDIEDTCVEADGEDNSEESSQEDDVPTSTVRQTRTSDVEPPVKLYEWIIKPVENSRGICLDGKRDKSIDEYWQTGVVTLRHGANMVETSSGSRYRLVGQMDLYEAAEAGMTAEIAKKFKRGFPVNWIQMLEDYFTDMEREESSPVEDGGDEPSKQILDMHHLPSRPKSTSGARQHDQFYIDSADSETDTTSQLEQVHERRRTRSSDANKELANLDSKGETSDDIFKPQEKGVKRKTKNSSNSKVNNVNGKKGAPKTKQTLQSSQENKPSQITNVADKSVTKLFLWIIKPLKGKTRGICLEGKRGYEDDYWHSSVIADRLDQKRVVTHSGSVYQLVGSIQKLDALEAGIPEKIVKNFQNGFPKNWKILLRQYYDPESFSDSEASMATDATITSVDAEKPKRSRKQPRKRTTKQKENVEVEPVDLDNTLCTPQGQLVDLADVPRTRSGRRVMPQLAWWVGQRRTFDGEGNTVEITYGTPHAESYVKQSFTDIKSRSTKSFRRQKIGVNSSSMSTKSNSTLESEVLGVLDKQKQSRLSESVKNIRETCYNKQKKERRKSKLDLLPIVPLTIMKEKSKNSMSESSDIDQNREIKGGKSCGKGLDMGSSSDDTEVDTNKPSRSRNKDSKRHKSSQEDTESDTSKKKPASKSRNSKGKNSKGDSHSQEESESDTIKSKLPVKTRKIRVSNNVQGVETDSESQTNKQPSRRRNSKVSKTTKTFQAENLKTAKQLSTKKNNGGSKKRKSAESSSESEVSQKKKKRNHVVERTEDSEISPTDAPKQTKINKSKKSSKDKGSDWGKAEIKRMYKAIERTSEEHPHFWEVVAESVETRSPEECRVFHETNNKNVNNPDNKKTKAKGKTKKGKGKSRKDEEDDFFEATPFRPGNNKTKTFNLTADETEAFDEQCMPTPGALHKTPIVKDIQSLQSLRLEKSLLMKSRIEMETTSTEEPEQQEVPSKAKNSKNKKVNEIEGLTAGKGTLKRKEQLREIYNKHNEGEEDDLFQATPIRVNQKKKKVPQMFTLTEEEELEFESGCIPTPGSRHKTPVVRDHNGRHQKMPTSSAKTVTTPWLGGLNRKTTDQVIAQNQRGGKQKKSISGTPKVKKAAPTKSLFRNETTLSNLFEEVDAAEDDEDDDKDYYWSDEN